MVNFRYWNSLVCLLTKPNSTLLTLALPKQIPCLTKRVEGAFKIAVRISTNDNGINNNYNKT